MVWCTSEHYSWKNEDVTDDKKGTAVRPEKHSTPTTPPCLPKLYATNKKKIKFETSMWMKRSKHILSQRVCN